MRIWLSTTRRRSHTTNLNRLGLAPRVGKKLLPPDPTQHTHRTSTSKMPIRPRRLKTKLQYFWIVDDEFENEERLYPELTTCTSLRIITTVKSTNGEQISQKRRVAHATFEYNEDESNVE